MVIAFREHVPRVHETAFIEPSARVIGDVEIGAQSSVWFHAVIRGDINHIRIGERTNLQDHVIVHVVGGRHPTYIGNDVTVGHRAVVHGCRIGDRALIGIGAIVLDGAEVSEDCLIAAGTLVTPRTSIPSGTLVMGAPGKVIRTLRPEELDHIRQSASNYCKYAEDYRAREDDHD